MGKKIYIDGSVVATTGNLYTRDIYCLCDNMPDNSVYYKPENGVWNVTENTGSIFDTYYVSGGVTALGMEKGDIYAFKSIYEFTVQDYRKEKEQLRALSEMDVPFDKQNLFYQQQFASAFSLLESFLSCTFLRETCDKEAAYHKVWKSDCLDKYTHRKEFKATALGVDCLDKELLFIEAVNYQMYHNANKVRKMFHVAFDVDVDLSSLEDRIQLRHDIVHRFGHDKKGYEANVTRDDVLSLLTDIDAIVEKTAEQMMK